MSVVGYSTLEVIPTVRNLRSQLESQTSRDLQAAGRRGGQQFGDAAGIAAGRSFKTKFSTLAKDVAAPVAGIFAGAAVVDLFKDAISGASDLAESGNKVKVIFGDATSEVDKFASRGAKALGQTKLQVLDAASSFGVFGKSAGLSGSALADFSTQLAGLSTDMASFFNTSPDQAIEAIGAALRGEAEPIRAYGVLLDDATLRQEALRQGLIQTTKQALTPQQRVLAAYQVILQQTSDAQGDFQRTAGGLANQQRILGAQWSEMKTELGSKLLPAVTATVRAFNDGVIPAVEGTGGVVADAIGWFDKLPTPVKAATGALVAFRAAQAFGAGNAFSAGSSLVSRGLEDIRLRAMLVNDEYKRLRQGQLDIIQGSGKFTPAAGRMASALGAIEVGAIGAGRGLKAGLSGALGLVGGPWGAAFIAGTAVLTHFWQENQKAKQRVQDLTESLDKQTGALTENSRETAFKALQDSGAVDAAKKLGINLATLTSAALDNKDAVAQVSAALDTQQQATIDAAGAQGRASSATASALKPIQTIREAISGQNGELEKAKSGWHDHAQAMQSSAADSTTAATATVSYTDKLKAARDAVRKLLDEENKRRNANLGVLGDQIALNQALADAREEAKKGKATLDLTTQAGRDNAGALRDLADAWNSSSGKVKNAKGAYSNMRDEFINVAEKMGATDGEARKLARRLLDLPKNVPVKFSTPGLAAALRDLRKLKEFASERIVITAQATKNRTARGDSFATGGKVGGRGTGDTRLIWADPREWVMKPGAVDYYGDDFMRRLNNLQVPRFAGGGPVGAAAPVASTPLGQEIMGALRIVDGVAYIEGVARAVDDRDRRASKLSALDGLRRR